MMIKSSKAPNPRWLVAQAAADRKVARVVTRAGLTLLEVLLTLAIMTALAALALPRLDGMLNNRRLVRGAEVVRVQMMNARLEAMRSGRTHLMRFPPDGTAMTTYVFHDMNDLTEAADQLGSGTALLQGGQPMAAPMPTAAGPQEEPRSVELPEGILFGETRVESTMRSLMVENQTQQLASAADPSQPILFYPDGTTSNAAITVQQIGEDGVAARIIVALRGLTGEATVGEELP